MIRTLFLLAGYLVQPILFFSLIPMVYTETNLMHQAESKHFEQTKLQMRGYVLFVVKNPLVGQAGWSQNCTLEEHLPRPEV